MVKLCDFEFSRCFSDKKDPYPRIVSLLYSRQVACVLISEQGTPYFMAHEVLTERHLVRYLRGPDSEANNLAAHLENVIVGSPQYERLKIFKTNISPRFTSLPSTATDDIPGLGTSVRHNFQHDLESIWWLMLYYITKCVDHQASYGYAEDIFQRSLTPSWQRVDCFEKNFIFEGRDFLHARLAKPFAHFVESLRGTMYKEYTTRAVFGQLQQPESYSYIHGFFATQFRALLQDEDSDWKHVPLVGFSPLTRPDATPTGTKRILCNTKESPRNKRFRHGGK